MTGLQPSTQGNCCGTVQRQMKFTAECDHSRMNENTYDALKMDTCHHKRTMLHQSASTTRRNMQLVTYLTGRFAHPDCWVILPLNSERFRSISEFRSAQTLNVRAHFKRFPPSYRFQDVCQSHWYQGGPEEG